MQTDSRGSKGSIFFFWRPSECTREIQRKKEGHEYKKQVETWPGRGKEENTGEEQI